MTVVEGRRRRSQIGVDSFSDITDSPVLDIAPCAAGTAVTFDGDLDANQIAAIRARMESTDDADQAERASLRADRDALPAGDPLRRLYDYVLGDAGL